MQGKKDGCKEWPIEGESLFSYKGGHPDDRDLAAAVEFYKKLIAGGVVNE